MFVFIKKREYFLIWFPNKKLNILWEKIFMNKLFLQISILLFVFACGGGGGSGSSAGTDSNSGGSGSTGTGTGSGYSVPGSFQPVDSE
mgnify:CR=1 FL=1